MTTSYTSSTVSASSPRCDGLEYCVPSVNPSNIAAYTAAISSRGAYGMYAMPAMAVNRVVIGCLPTVVAGFILHTTWTFNRPMNSWDSS